jgi:transposase-like protein
VHRRVYGGLPDDYIVARIMRRGVKHTPQYCPECGGELSSEARSLCYLCESNVVDEFEGFLQSLSPEQLECLDRLCEGTSLVDIARR